MKILLIRHGESEADLLGVHEGRADFPLTTLGHAQAKKVAAWIQSEYKPAVMLASPLKRAHQTATYIQQAVGCPLHTDDSLMEFNNGVLAGLDRQEALRRYPMPEGGRPFHVPIEGGESELAFRLRAEEWVHRLEAEYSQHDCVAIVSHGGWISQFLKAFLDLPATSPAIFATGDTGVHLIEWRDGKKIVRFMNKQEHLFQE